MVFEDSPTRRYASPVMASLRATQFYAFSPGSHMSALLHLNVIAQDADMEALAEQLLT